LLRGKHAVQHTGVIHLTCITKLHEQVRTCRQCPTPVTVSFQLSTSCPTCASSA